MTTAILRGSASAQGIIPAGNSGPMVFGTAKCPEPGVYPNVPFDTYCAWDALNHSRLKACQKSASHFREGPHDKETDSKVVGVALHEIVLEPAKFAGRVDLPPINPKTSKPFGRDTQAWRDYAAERPGKLILTRDEVEMVGAMRTKIMAHPDAGVIFDKGNGAQFEVCIVWNCPITGLRCKGRVDVWIPRDVKSVIRADLKSTRCAEWRAFGRSIVDYGYHTQDAFYELGCQALGFASRGYLIPIETEAPYELQIAPIEDDTLEAGRKNVRRWLGMVKHGLETGQWPGYPTPCAPFKAPEWYLMNAEIEFAQTE